MWGARIEEFEIYSQSPSFSKKGVPGERKILGERIRIAAARQK
jgi:hypothetical protein